MFRKDNLGFGILLGFLAPLLGMLLYYFVEFYTRNVSFVEYLGYLKRYKSLLTGVSSISLVANAVIFTVYINTRRDATAKGIFVATILYGVAVLVIKFFM